jgi:hypothetical protein
MDTLANQNRDQQNTINNCQTQALKLLHDPGDVTQHAMNCAGFDPMRDCTCGLYWRVQMQTEREMHNAWRKRAEEAEAREITLQAQLQAVTQERDQLLAAPHVTDKAATK